MRDFSRSLWALVVVCSFLLLPTAAFAQGKEPEPPGETIVYSSIQPSNWDLYLFDRPGSTPRRLTTDPGLDYGGVISPDGRWVVFTSERSGNPDLYVLDLEGDAGPRPLVESPALEDAAAISPDGRRLLFVSTRDGNADIFATRFRPWNPSAAGEAVNLTRHAAGDYNPAFSPDGTRILFSSSRDTTVATSTTPSLPPHYQASEVYVMQADGTGVRRLTHHENWDGAPAWTPDGRQVVFYSQRDGDPRIYRAGIDGMEGGDGIEGGDGADGAMPEPISAEGEAALSPVPAPDGRLAFTARRDDRWTIVSTRLDGSDPRVESDTARDYWAPAYDPVSGRLLAHGPGPIEQASRFESDAPGAFRIHRPLRVAMPGRRVSLIGIRGYLPAVDPTSGEVATSEAFARLVASRPDGTGKRVVFDLAGADRYPGSGLHLGAHLVEGWPLAGVRGRTAVRARQRGCRHLEDRRRRGRGHGPDRGFGGQRRVPRLLSRRPPHRLPQHARRQRRDLRDERRRRQRATPDAPRGDRHDARVLFGRRPRRIHVVPGRELRDLHRCAR